MTSSLCPLPVPLDLAYPLHSYHLASGRVNVTVPASAGLAGTP